MARFDGFSAGAAAAAGALVAAPDAYRRLRTLVEPPERKALPPGPTAEPHAETAPAVETKPAVDPAESDALRERIEDPGPRAAEGRREPGDES